MIGKQSKLQRHFMQATNGKLVAVLEIDSILRFIFWPPQMHVHDFLPIHVVNVISK